MLNRIAWGTFVTALGCILLLKNQIPPVATFLAHWTFEVKVLDVGVPIGLALSAGAIAFLARIFKWHDVLSSVFGLRRKFDVERILIPLAAGTNHFIDREQIQIIREHRHPLMQDCFYRYASSTKPELDVHIIILALDNWSWYWLLLEALTLLIPTAAVLMMFGRVSASLTVLVGVLAIAGIMFLIYGRAKHYARLEVQAILSEGARAKTIGEEFNAVLGTR